MALGEREKGSGGEREMGGGVSVITTKLNVKVVAS